jgi:hypothetical protein
MERLKYAFLLSFTLLILAALSFIPSRITGFATQVEPIPRTFIGFILFFLVVTVLVVSKRKMKTIEQLVYEDRDSLIKSVLERCKLDPYKQASSVDVYTIVEILGEEFNLSKRMQEGMERYVSKKVNEMYSKGYPPPTTRDVILFCLYYKLQKTLRAEERKRMRKGWRRQI